MRRRLPGLWMVISRAALLSKRKFSEAQRRSRGSATLPYRFSGRLIRFDN